MAQLNMLSGGGHWNMMHHGFNGSTHGGSNMSLNMPQHGFDQPVWNPWMQQFQMMPPMMGGELEMFKLIYGGKIYYQLTEFSFNRRNATEVEKSFTRRFASFEYSFTAFNDEFKKPTKVSTARLDRR